MIMNILGSPTQDDLDSMKLTSQPKLPKVQAKGLSQLLKEIDPMVIDLIGRLLVYNPNK